MGHQVGQMTHAAGEHHVSAADSSSGWQRVRSSDTFTRASRPSSRAGGEEGQCGWRAAGHA